MSQGTRCHQLAMYVIYESPLQMLADSPSNYYKEVETMDFLKQVPVTWDETKVIEAKIGDYIIIARKKGSKWFLGGMTDWTARTFEIDLSLLGNDFHQISIWQDGFNADKNPQDLKYFNKAIEQKQKLEINMAQGGGWVAIIE